MSFQANFQKCQIVPARSWKFAKFLIFYQFFLLIFCVFPLCPLGNNKRDEKLAGGPLSQTSICIVFAGKKGASNTKDRLLPLSSSFFFPEQNISASLRQEQQALFRAALLRQTQHYRLWLGSFSSAASGTFPAPISLVCLSREMSRTFFL